MKPIELQIFHHSDQTSQFKDLDIEYKLSDCEIRPVTFYHINAISPFYYENDKSMDYSSIHSNNTEYICNISYKKLKQKLDENN